MLIKQDAATPPDTAPDVDVVVLAWRQSGCRIDDCIHHRFDLTYTPAAGYTGADAFRYQVRDAEFFSADATMALTVTSDIFVLNGSFETPNPPTTSPGGAWGNLDCAWKNNLANYARRHDGATPILPMDRKSK